MSKKRNNKSIKPYANEIIQAREAMKKMIDEMSDYEFIHFSLMVTGLAETLEEELKYDALDEEDLPF